MEEKVRKLHEMINASIFGWPNTEEVKKAHELLDEIRCAACTEKIFLGRSDMASPTPTRKEWSEWVEHMPSPDEYTPPMFKLMLATWFLTMPGVPKE